MGQVRFGGGGGSVRLGWVWLFVGKECDSRLGWVWLVGLGCVVLGLGVGGWSRLGLAVGGVGQCDYGLGFGCGKGFCRQAEGEQDPVWVEGAGITDR